MVEVTQADRDAAASGYFAWCSGNPVIPSKMKDGKADDHSMVQAFARHRTEATAALEERVKLLEQRIHDAEEIWGLEAAFRRVEIRPHTGHGPGPRVTQAQRQRENEAWEKVQAARRAYLERWEPTS